ncbi:MAG TPA: pyruvate kinase [Gemmatimonadaceae bacterium]|nr:pyruvate kinase [Gemmatimonadaceae bacterium]
MKQRTPRAKIVATLGPASRGEDVLRALLESGVDVARVNFSHGTHDEHAETIATIRRIARELKRPVALLADLQGPRIRIGEIDKPIVVEPGNDVRVAPEDEAKGDDVPITYGELAQDVRIGSRVLVDDGNLEFTVVTIDGRRVVLRAVHGGPIRAHKGINLPGVEVSAPSLTDKDRADVTFGVAADVDYFALSFVRKSDDVQALRALVPPGRLIVAKIEKDSALKHMEGVVRAADAVMVARGDLGVELPYEAVPLVQKRIIALCNQLGRPVITATQMLESMVTHARPTRAEASDVANAVLDGTDAVMLSAETAVGQYPTHAVRAMRRIVTEIEKHPRPRPRAPESQPGGAATEEIIAAAGETAARLLQAPAIVVFTKSGFSARVISARRPVVPILALTDQQRTFQQLSLIWGVIPKLVPHCDTYEQMLTMAREMVRSEGLAKTGDRVLVTAGVPFDVIGTTNTLKVEVV